MNVKKQPKNRKLIIWVGAVAIVLLTLIALVPLIFSLVVGAGVKTEPINPQHAKPASVELDGDWEIVQGSSRNFSSVGFTFYEVLPAEKTTTSGSTTNVTGGAKIAGETLEEARVVVDMTKLNTDKMVRDQNMKDKLFETERFPEATFELTKPVDLAGVPDDGTMGSVQLTGDLTIKGETREVTGDFDVLRDGEHVVVGGDLPVNRLDFGVKTPEFIAAKIDEEGFINIRLSFDQK